MALHWYQASASQEFGRAKVALDLYSLDGWRTSRRFSENEMIKIQSDANQQKNDAASFLFATEFPRTMLRKLDAKVIAEMRLETLEQVKRESIVLDYLRGVFLFDLKQYEEGIINLRRAASGGHFLACDLLSRHYDKTDMLNESILWRTLGMQNEGFRGVVPMLRLHQIKLKISARRRTLEHRYSLRQLAER